MKELVEGINRFKTDTLPKKAERFASLAGSQAPKTLFITCSDSRVVPNLITDAEPGELFVIRNAGNMIPPFSATPGGEEATVEYAVAALGVEHIVVCGHSNCGAMKGLLNPEALKPLPAVAQWLELARPTKAALEALEGVSDDDRLLRAIQLNTLRQIDNLRTHPSVASALQKGKVQLHAWVYDIGEGKVWSYDEEKREFTEIETTLSAVGRALTLDCCK